MHNDDTAELRAQLRTEIKADQLPPPLWYLPKMASLARDIESLAQKVNRVPDALLRHAFEGLAPEFERLLAATRENLKALGEPSSAAHKELEELTETFETASDIGPHTDSLSDMLCFLEGLEKHLHGVYARIGTHCVDTLSYMEWTPKPEFQQENATRLHEILGLHLLEPVAFATEDGRTSYQVYASFELGTGAYRVDASGDRTDDGRWREREVTYALASGEGGWVERSETAIPLSPEQKQQIMEEVRAEVQTAWARLLEAVTGGPTSSDPSDEAD